MTGCSVAAVGEALAASLGRDTAACAILGTQLLALGRPVFHDNLAVALCWAHAEVVAALCQVPGVELDAHDHSVAAGLSGPLGGGTAP